MMTGEDYKASLNDGRVVVLEGERVLDMPNHPIYKAPVDLAASLYDRGYDPTPGAVRATIRTIQSKEDLREHAMKHEATDILLGVTSASIMTMLTAAGRIEERLPENAERIRAYVKEAQRPGRAVFEVGTQGGENSHKLGIVVAPPKTLDCEHRYSNVGTAESSKDMNPAALTVLLRVSVTE